MSTAPPKVYACIAAVMSAMGKEGISKDRRNLKQNYNFRGIDDVYNALNGHLSREGLIVLPRVENVEREERRTKEGGLLIYTRLMVDFELVAIEDGSSHTIRTVGEAMDSADKSSNKAMSAAYKYAAMQVFCIPTEGDNDAEATTHEVAPRAPAKPIRKPADDMEAARAFVTALQMAETLTDLAEWQAENLAAIQSMSGPARDMIRDALREHRALLTPTEEKEAA